MSKGGNGKRRSKGGRGERELCRVLTDVGFPADRDYQYVGGKKRPEVRCPSLPFHWECKRQETSSPWAWLRQAIDDAAEDKVPAVAWRKSRHPWMVMLRLEDLLELLREK